MVGSREGVMYEILREVPTSNPHVDGTYTAAMGHREEVRSHVAADRRTKRRTLAGAATLLIGSVLSSSGSGVEALPQLFAQIEAPLLSVNARALGDATGAYPTVSGDGRYVVYQGIPTPDDESKPADDSIPTDIRSSTIFLTDRTSEATIELSPVPDGLRSGDTVFPVISGDGCTVVAVTQMALDVFRDDDTGDRWDVYRLTLPHCMGAVGDWDLVSTRNGSGGISRDDVMVEAPTISRSGASVAYTHPADHLFDAAGIRTISLVDVTVPVDDPGRSRFVAGSPADSPTSTFIHSGLDQPALSDDGSNLAYRSDATSSDAVPGWAEGLVDGAAATTQVYVWDIDQPDPFLAVSLVSANVAGTPALAGASEPDISRDGMSITFTSPDVGLVDAVYAACTTDCPSQVFVVDRDTNDDGQIGSDDSTELRLVSVRNDTTPPVAGTSPSSQPSISADGQLVAFVTKAANLQLIEVPGIGSGDDGDLLLAEVSDGRLTRLTNAAGVVVPTPGVHAHPNLSDAGRTAVFDTAAANELLLDGALSGRQVIARSSDPLLSLPDADLGTTLVGRESDEWYVAVINDGPSSFQPDSVTISDPQFVINEEKSTCLLANSVPAGGSCTVALSFTPSGPGPSSAVLGIAETGFGSVSVSASIEGAGGIPALRIEPGGHDLGVVTVGEPSTEFQFDLSNIGFSPTLVTSFAVTGAHTGDFSFTSNACAFRILNPRASCSVGVTFTPSDAGRRTALVELATVDGQYTTVVLAGDGEFAPVVKIDTELVEVGGDFVATGTRYPPNTEVTVVFGDGPKSSVLTVTDELGNFEVTVPVDANERGGDRIIVVQSASGAAATAPIEVVGDGQVFVGMPGFGLG
jgi:hypothetical protein